MDSMRARSQKLLLNWKTADGTAYLRALMHDDGNIRYANYQSEAQMTDYLTTQGHESVVDEIV